MTLTWRTQPPYGGSNLKPGISESYKKRDPGCIRDGQIICCVDGCRHWLIPRRQKSKDFTFCPEHNISLSPSTYVHQAAKQNLIVYPELFVTIHKTENRLTNENSEDALSWNVFVGLYALGALREVFYAMTNLQPESEPELYLWSNRIHHQTCSRWSKLDEEQIRKSLEPKKRIRTEPDIVLRIPGRALVFIEAKFRSPNSRYNKKENRFCIHDYLKAYPVKPGHLDPLNRDWIGRSAPRAILEQLCRNAMLAHWVAEPNEQIFLINLVSADFETNIEQEFKTHLARNQITFRRFTWESIAMLCAVQHPEAEPLRKYFEDKTYSLRPAFPSLRSPSNLC